MQAKRLALIYSGLSQALAVETAWPDWLCLPGPQWPFWQPVARLAATAGSPALDEVLETLAAVPTASKETRQHAYEAIFSRQETSALALYGSHHLHGRLLGPETARLADLYGRFGLETAGAELPDHASVELEFLAYVAEKEAAGGADAVGWRALRRHFIDQYAGKWLPAVGKQLAASPEPAWAATGRLLLAMLAPAGNRRAARMIKEPPKLVVSGSCSLCGFCVQTCPTGALWIEEDSHTTRLRFGQALCVSCRKCEKVCRPQAVQLSSDPAVPAAGVLRQSARVKCPSCGSPTVSQAELTAVIASLGDHPRWLDTCHSCRGLALSHGGI